MDRETSPCPLPAASSGNLIPQVLATTSGPSDTTSASTSELHRGPRPSPKRKRASSSCTTTDPLPKLRASRNHHILKSATQEEVEPFASAASAEPSGNMRLWHYGSSSPPPRPNKDHDQPALRKPARSLAPRVLAPVPDHASPRAHVAYQFSGLLLENALPPSFPILGPRPPESPSLATHASISFCTPSHSRSSSDGSSSASSVADSQAADLIHKRMRFLSGNAHHDRAAHTVEVPETPVAGKTFQISIGSERRVDPMIREKAGEVRLWNELDLRVLGGAESSALVRSRCAEMELERGRRMGSPPLHAQDAAVDSAGRPDCEEDKTWLHGEWAALYRKDLTWSDDEITGHNPSDPEDDGEGINGVGFRPTKAVAWRRTQTRRQQVAEYKTREEREARAKRRAVRGGGEAAGSGAQAPRPSARKITGGGGSIIRNFSLPGRKSPATTAAGPGSADRPSAAAAAAAAAATAPPPTESPEMQARRERIAREMEDAVRRVRFLDGDASSTASSRYR